MTTGLIKPGMTLEQACEAVCDEADRLRTSNGTRVGLWTEVGARSVLVGLSIAGVGASVVQIDRAEYDGMALMDLVCRHGAE